MAHGLADPPTLASLEAPIPREAGADALDEARSRLERREAERDAHAALVAHDLRNPLASVRFGAELLLHDPDTPERVRFLAEQIVASTDSALALLSAYLEPPAPRPRAQLARIAVDAALEAAVQRAQPRAARAGIPVRCGRLAPYGAVAAPRWLSRGFDALLEGLVEATPPGGAIVVSLEAEAGPRARAVFASPAPPPSREAEQRWLRQYARLRVRPAAAEPDSALARARQALEAAGAELHRLDGPGTRWVVELAANP